MGAKAVSIGTRTRHADGEVTTREGGLMRPFIPACCPDDIRRDGVFWSEPRRPKWWREAVRKAKALAKVLDAENKRLCEECGRMVAADQIAERERLRILAEDSAATKDLADSIRAATVEAGPLLAAMSIRYKKKRRNERRAIRREEAKLREDVKKLVQLKVQRFKARHLA
jgi:hypothetical protein